MFSYCLGKDKSVDDGFSLTLALVARSDVFTAQNEHKFALDDLKLATAEGVPDWMR